MPSTDTLSEHRQGSAYEKYAYTEHTCAETPFARSGSRGGRALPVAFVAANQAYAVAAKPAPVVGDVLTAAQRDPQLAPAEHTAFRALHRPAKPRERASRLCAHRKLDLPRTARTSRCRDI